MITDTMFRDLATRVTALEEMAGLRDDEPETIAGGFYLSARSIARLEDVHPDLVRVVERAIGMTEVDFVVLEGRRSRERQADLVKSGASQTMNSRHLTGHAVDLGAWIGGKVDWSWPPYHKIATAMKAAAEAEDVPLEWGGDWTSFKDGPHYQLPWKEYPA